MVRAATVQSVIAVHYDGELVQEINVRVCIHLLDMHVSSN